MFTGLIETKAKLIKKTSNSISLKIDLENIKLGDSIAINGICLTVSNIFDNEYCFDVSPESQKQSNIKSTNIGEFVNIERALLTNGRLDGHFVTGHVDSVAKLIKKQNHTDFTDFFIELKDSTPYAVNKGSISINGISLTINEINDKIIRLTIIPHTIKSTNLINIKQGDLLNIEFDILAKYTEKMLNYKPSNKIDENFLRENGYA